MSEKRDVNIIDAMGEPYCDDLDSLPIAFFDLVNQLLEQHGTIILGRLNNCKVNPRTLPWRPSIVWTQGGRFFAAWQLDRTPLRKDIKAKLEAALGFKLVGKTFN